MGNIRHYDFSRTQDYDLLRARMAHNDRQRRLRSQRRRELLAWAVTLTAASVLLGYVAVWMLGGR